MGIVHLGVGNFHRAHQAVYLDDLLGNDDMSGFGIAGINLMPGGGALLDTIRGRGMRYVLKTVSPANETRYREIASIVDCADFTEHPDQAISLLASPEVCLVTLTITGAGYHLDKLGGLDTSAAEVASELDGGPAKTVYGLLRAGLTARMDAGAGPITLLSCDNMRGNGALLKGAMEGYLVACGDGRLAEWLSDNATYPCSMVDRITPVTPPGLGREVRELFGIDDDPALMAESYIQWVIEDKFAARMPPLESVGAQITGDVHSHEEAKIRILNGGHMSLAYKAALRGHEFVWQAAQDKELAAFYDSYVKREAIPAITKGVVDLAAYHEATKARFANTNLDDTVARICRQGTTKVPEFVMPTLSDSYDRGVVPRLGLSVVASWYEVMRRQAAGDGPIRYEDVDWDDVKGHLEPGGEEGFARDKKLWGDLPARHKGFAADLVASIKEAASGRVFPAVQAIG